MNSDAILLPVSGLWKGTSAFDAPRGLALFIAILMSMSALIYGGGHAQAAVLDAHVAAVEHSHHVPCNDKGDARDDGGCCVTASGCTFCVPVAAEVLADFTRSEPAAVSPPSASLPSDVLLQLRPPKPIVTA